MSFKNGKIIKQEGFEPLELTEANVQAIFNRCLAEVEDRKTTVWATLFPPELGYEYDPEEGKKQDAADMDKQQVFQPCPIIFHSDCVILKST